MRILALVLLTAFAAVPGAAARPGAAQKPVPQLLAEVRAAVDSAHTVHVIGSGRSGGSAVSLNLRLVASVGGDGTIEQNGFSFRIVRLYRRAYFNAGRRFWRRFAGAAAGLYDGRWIEASATSGGLAAFTPVTTISALLADALDGRGTRVIGRDASYDGQPAFAIEDTANGSVLYVAASGPPYPLAIKPARGAGAGLISFEDWNASVRIAAPADAIDYLAPNG